MVTVNHPIAGKVDVPFDIFKDPAKYNEFLLQNAPDKEYGTLDVMGSQFASGFTDSMRGISDFFTDDDTRTDQEVQQRYLDEFENRLELEQNPVAAWTALLAGSVVDPVALPAAILAPVKVASKVASLAIRGAAQGAFGGGVAATYEEFGDSRTENILYGGLLGGVIGGAAGTAVKVFSKADVDAANGLQNIADDAEKAIDDVAADVAAAEGKTADEVKAEIKQSDELLPDFLPQKEARQLSMWEVKTELEQDIPNILSKPEVAKAEAQLKEAEAQLDVLNQTIVNMQKSATGRTGKAKYRIETMLDQEYAVHDEWTKYRDALQARIDGHARGVEAEADIAELNKGNVPKRHKDRVNADVKANEKARAEYKQRVKDQRVTDEVAVGKDVPEETPQQPMRTGLETPETSASAAATRPEAVYNPEAIEGVDTAALTRSETTTNLEGVEPAQDKGLGLTENQLKRQTLRKEASREQIESMIPVNGKYSQEAVTDAAWRLRNELEQEGDYDTLMEYLEERVAEMSKGRGTFSSVEIEMLQPIFELAEVRLVDTGKKIRGLVRRGELDSLEGVKAVQDLQFYNYISDIDLAVKSSVSDALRQFKRVKNLRKNHAAQVRAGKPIKNAFADINGRSMC